MFIGYLERAGPEPNGVRITEALLKLETLLIALSPGRAKNVRLLYVLFERREYISRW